MQCTSPCSTSAAWSSGHTPVVVCEVLSRRRRSVSLPTSPLRSCNVHPSSLADREELESTLFSISRREHCQAPSLIQSHYVSPANRKSTINSAGLATPAGVSVDYDIDEVASAGDCTNYAAPLSISRSSRLLLEESTFADSIPEREQIAVRPRIGWRHETWDDEEVRKVVVDCLESRGLSSTLSLIAVQKAPTFISHLISLLQSCYPARYRSGKQFTRSEIRCVVLPYLASLGSTQRKDIDGLCGDFSSVPDLASFVPPPGTTSKILSGYPLLRERLKDGKLPPALSYCLTIGLKPTQVEAALKKFPPIVGYKVEGKIEKVVDFILSLDVSSSLIPAIVLKRPQLFGCSVEDNLRPSVKFLEDLGVERTRWGRILVSFPHMLTYSSAKSNLVFNFLLDCGVSHAAAGKVLNRFPHAVGYSVELKLKPLAAYFHSLGIQDFSRVITRSPQTLGLSLEHNIKPTVQFFRSTLGLSVEEIALVLNRFPQILGLSVEQNLLPKWQFFLGMNRCKTQLLEFPQYFGYSLENRILPRYKIVEEKQIGWTLNRMLCTSKEVFFRLTDEYN